MSLYFYAALYDGAFLTLNYIKEKFLNVEIGTNDED
jgi:hypothetical protein